jgi:hypothetical protein
MAASPELFEGIGGRSFLSDVLRNDDNAVREICALIDWLLTFEQSQILQPLDATVIDAYPRSAAVLVINPAQSSILPVLYMIDVVGRSALVQLRRLRRFLRPFGRFGLNTPKPDPAEYRSPNARNIPKAISVQNPNAARYPIVSSAGPGEPDGFEG